LLNHWFFIVSICPGGTTSNYISYLINSDTALSVSLTGINSFLILFTVPLFATMAIHFWGGQNIQGLSVLDTFFQIFLMITLPTLVGVYFNEKFPQISNRIQKTVKIMSGILIAFVFTFKFFASGDNGGVELTGQDLLLLLPPCLILHFGAMIISFLIASSIGLARKCATTIGIEVGLQNTALSILVTSTMIGNSEMSKPALVFAMFSFFTTLIFGLISLHWPIQRRLSV